MDPITESYEINEDDLEAAANMYNKLIAGTFYAAQEASGFTIKYIGIDTFRKS